VNSVVRVPFVDLSAQYKAIQKAVDEAMADVLRKTDFILGEEVELFEQEFATFCEARHAIGVDSGLSALELILRAYEIGPGDEVITVANTFIATVLAISSVGAKPVLVDADPQTYNMDVTGLEQAITPHTKAVMPVHLYGQPADMDPILEIAHRHGLVVIEDACQAHGARYKGKRVGSLGHAAAFSFYPAKNLGAYGDGGMVVANDERVTQTVRTFRNYGQRAKYDHVVRGYNHRLDTLQAAVLRVKLEHLADWNAARRRHAQQYGALLAQSPVACPVEADFAESVYHLYVVRVERRDELQGYLQDQGIATGIHYPLPIHLQPAYQGLGYQPGDFPVSEQCAKRILSLPMYSELESESIDHVAQAIERFTHEHSLEPAYELLACAG
jgi:dTDP-4-amino-4,6-dideoxygalactose transaminase